MAEGDGLGDVMTVVGDGVGVGDGLGVGVGVDVGVGDATGLVAGEVVVLHLPHIFAHFSGTPAFLAAIMGNF